MREKRMRVRLRLRGDADAEATLAAAREVLGRPLEPVTRVQTARLLSFTASRTELDALRRLPGVERAEPEGRCELPPRPGKPRQERE